MEMQSKQFVLIVIIFLIFIIGVGAIIFWWGPVQGRKQTFRELVGKYRIDLKKTDLRSFYIKDSTIFKDLEITLASDSSFRLNMEVPFLYSSKGKWTAGNVSEWCRLLFDGLNYDGLPYPGSQFTRPFKDNDDTFFLINAATPKDDQKTITSIYFKRIK